MAKYKKRKDGRYSTSITIGHDENGKPIKKVIYGRTTDEVDNQKIDISWKLKNGSFILNDNTTVKEWAIEWLKTYKNNVEYNTKLMYETMINVHIIPHIGQLKLKDIKPQHIQKMINEKANEGKTRTAQKISLTIKQIFKKAIENNLLTRNPTESIEMPKREKTKKRALTDDEKTYIDEANLDIKSKAFIHTILYTGLRKGEALALTKGDINLKEKTLTVNKTLITKGNTPEIKQSPKSKAGNRTIPIPDIMIKTLTDYLPTVENNFIFPSASNTIMSKAASRRFWEKLINQINEAALIKEITDEEKLKEELEKRTRIIKSDITPHIFRHTYATMLYYAGVDIKTAQYLLGHSSINITMEIYTHLDDGKIIDAVAKLNDMLSSSQK